MLCGLRQLNSPLASPFLAAAVLLGAGAPAAGADRPLPLAICVEYLGESDKPVFPLVIAAAQPSRDGLKALLGADSNPDFVHLFVFSAAEVRGLAAQIAKQLGQMPPSPPAAGVVRVTVAGISLSRKPTGEETEAQNISRVLGPEGAHKVFEALDGFSPADATALSELKQAVADFRKRTQLK